MTAGFHVPRRQGTTFLDSYIFSGHPGMSREGKIYINIFHNQKICLLPCSTLNISVLLHNWEKKEKQSEIVEIKLGSGPRSNSRE